jgi:hypothetical protein
MPHSPFIIIVFYTTVILKNNNELTLHGYREAYAVHTLNVKVTFRAPRSYVMIKEAAPFDLL